MVRPGLLLVVELVPEQGLLLVYEQVQGLVIEPGLQLVAELVTEHLVVLVVELGL